MLDEAPHYEDHLVNGKEHHGYFRACDVRKRLYRSVYSGGCGVTCASGSPGANYVDRCPGRDGP